MYVSATDTKIELIKDVKRGRKNESSSPQQIDYQQSVMLLSLVDSIFFRTVDFSPQWMR